MPILNIIMITYNGASDTINCVKSLLDNNKNYFQLRIFIIDNNSNDIDFLENQIRKLNTQNNIMLIKNKKNLGFAAANNIGLNYLKEKNLYEGYLWFLNNDTLISSDLLYLMSTTLPKEQQVEYFEMHNFDDKYYNTGLNYINLLTGKYSETSKMNYVPYICGASIFLKCTQNVPMWNELFFLYYEDVDYSFQLEKKGYDFIQLKGATYKHKISASSKNKSGINLIKAESQKKFMKEYGKNYSLYCILKFLYLFKNLRFKEIKILFS